MKKQMWWTFLKRKYFFLYWKSLGGFFQFFFLVERAALLGFPLTFFRKLSFIFAIDL